MLDSNHSFIKWFSKWQKTTLHQMSQYFIMNNAYYWNLLHFKAFKAWNYFAFSIPKKTLLSLKMFVFKYCVWLAAELQECIQNVSLRITSDNISGKTFGQWINSIEKFRYWYSSEIFDEFRQSRQKWTPSVRRCRAWKAKPIACILPSRSLRMPPRSQTSRLNK